MTLDYSAKLTEDEAIILLMTYLKYNDYTIDSHCLGQQRGCDIVASKNLEKLYIEVKGAKAGKNSPTKKREYFDAGQIKTHLGKAIVKILEDQLKSPNGRFAIAHPDDKEMRRAIGHLIPSLKRIGIIHYWVSPDGNVIEDYV
jgi:hypothetical protein